MGSLIDLAAVELRQLSLPLVAPFRTAHGTVDVRDVLLVRALTTDGEGWGECVADVRPVYSSEYVEGCADVLRRHLVPTLARSRVTSATAAEESLSRFQGHPMAKAAVTTALLDAELRSLGRSLADQLGATRATVPCGVSVGIMTTVEELLDVVEQYLDEGYVRIKLKIEPGWDLEPVAAVRERFGPDVVLQVDANTSYGLADARHLAELDDFDLVLIEQPLPEDDLLGHAALAKLVKTPICLDETITSARVAAQAIQLGACQVVNIKPGRVGGYAEARRIHDVCRAHGVPVWCGGMLETGIGRAANLALAALPGFTLPGDTSASSRYYRQDVTAPFVLDGGHLAVPCTPGIGVQPLPEILDELTTRTELLMVRDIR